MEKVYRLKNLDCANCAQKIERAVKKLDGVTDANVNFMTQKLTLVAEEDRFSTLAEEVQAAITKIEPDTKLV